jgi:hypothetical protein
MAGSTAFLATGLESDHYGCMAQIKPTPVVEAPSADSKTITPSLVMAAFQKAAKKAVAENDRLGIVTHGSVDGKIVERQPPKVRVRQTS